MRSRKDNMPRCEELGIDKLDFDAEIIVTQYDGCVVRGIYDSWTSDLDNDPDPGALPSGRRITG